MAELTNTEYQLTNYANLASNLSSVVNAFTAGKMASNLAKHNAVMAGFERYWIDKRVDQQIEILYDDEARILGANRASHGGDGFSIASETNKDLERDIITNVGKEASVIRAQGGLDKMKVDNKVSQFKSKARSAGTAGNLKAATALTRTTQSKGFVNLFKK